MHSEHALSVVISKGESPRHLQAMSLMIRSDPQRWMISMWKARSSLCLFSITTASIIKAFYCVPFIFPPQLWSSVLKEQERIKYHLRTPYYIQAKHQNHGTHICTSLGVDEYFSFRCMTFQKMAAVIHEIQPQCVKNSLSKEGGSPLGG